MQIEVIMHINKTIYILLSLTILLISTSCDNTAVNTISETSIQTETPIEYKTVEPPEDGWTLELLNEVTYINGKDIDLPFCLNDLGDEFGYTDLDYANDKTSCDGFITYNGKRAIPFISINIGEEFDYNDEITLINVRSGFNSSELDINNFLVINGVSLSSDFDECLIGLGNYSDIVLEDSYCFSVGNNEHALWAILSYESEKIDTFRVSFMEGY
jgi:hypothetical protein